VLAGISFGGLMAFEAAHQLNEQGGKVEMVILLDAQAKYPAPHEVAWQKLQKDWKPEPNQRSTDRASQTFASRLGGSLSIIQWMLVKEMKQLGRPMLRAITGDLGPLTPRFDDLGVPMHWALVERVYANALRTYRLRRLDCRGVLFRADLVEERPARALDGSLGWANLFARGLEIIQVPGDHLTMFQQKSNLLTLAREMSNLLNRSSPTPTE
jgi:thioesterase domain-containing protein